LRHTPVAGSSINPGGQVGAGLALGVDDGAALVEGEALAEGAGVDDGAALVEGEALAEGAGVVDGLVEAVILGVGEALREIEVVGRALREGVLVIEGEAVTVAEAVTEGAAVGVVLGGAMLTLGVGDGSVVVPAASQAVDHKSPSTFTWGAARTAETNAAERTKRMICMV
jgi:hypothetical protein